MNNLLFKNINIFLKVNEQTINDYFNANDPAPIYKRQLSQEFEEYIMNYSVTIKNYSVVTYKLNCVEDSDKEFAEPLIHAIRRHFSLKKAIKEAEFKTFKRKNWFLLASGLFILMAFQGLMSLFMSEEDHLLSIFVNAVDVFIWVILWKPLETLLFSWKPFQQEISVMDKLTNAATAITIKNRQLASVEHAA